MKILIIIIFLITTLSSAEEKIKMYELMDNVTGCKLQHYIRDFDRETGNLSIVIVSMRANQTISIYDGLIDHCVLYIDGDKAEEKDSTKVKEPAFEDIAFKKNI